MIKFRFCMIKLFQDGLHYLWNSKKYECHGYPHAQKHKDLSRIIILFRRRLQDNSLPKVANLECAIIKKISQIFTPVDESDIQGLLNATSEGLGQDTQEYIIYEITKDLITLPESYEQDLNFFPNQLEPETIPKLLKEVTTSKTPTKLITHAFDLRHTRTDNFDQKVFIKLWLYRVLVRDVLNTLYVNTIKNNNLLKSETALKELKQKYEDKRLTVFSNIINNFNFGLSKEIQETLSQEKINSIVKERTLIIKKILEDKQPLSKLDLFEDMINKEKQDYEVREKAKNFCLSIIKVTTLGLFCLIGCLGIYRLKTR